MTAIALAGHQCRSDICSLENSQRAYLLKPQDEDNDELEQNFGPRPKKGPSESLTDFHFPGNFQGGSLTPSGSNLYLISDQSQTLLVIKTIRSHFNPVQVLYVPYSLARALKLGASSKLCEVKFKITLL